MQEIQLIISGFLLLSCIAGTFVIGISQNRLYKTLFGLGIWTVLLYSILYFVADSFTGAGFNEGVSYHLKYGFKNLDWKLFKNMILLSILGIIVMSFGVFWSVCRSRITSQKFSFIFFIILVLAILVHPTSHYLFQLSKQFFEGEEPINPDSTFFDYYQYPQIKKIGPHKNIVVLYLESLERTYLDENLFPDLTPNLKALESQSISFTNLSQTPEMGFTIAGSVGSQCGIPLITPSHGNHMKDVESYLQKAICLGDILSEQGYHLSYYGGADAEFAGKINFYKTHQIDEIIGKKELLSLSESNDSHHWGVYDDTTLEAMYQQFISLSESEKLFGIIGFTIDTHSPGYVSQKCRKEEIKYQENDQILNAVHCSDFLVAEFVDKIRTSPYTQNTVVVLASDHLAMKNSVTDRLKKGQRKPLMLINLPDKISKKIRTKGSLLDFTSTILPFIGFEGNVGLGRNLLKQDLEQAKERFKFIKNNIQNWRQELLSFWAFPKLQKNLIFDTNNQKVWIKETSFNIPILLQLTEELSVRPVFRFHPFRSPKVFSPAQTSEYDHLYIDKCHNTNLMINTSFIEAPEESFCLLSQFEHRELKQDSKISKTEVLSMIGSKPLSPSILVEASFPDQVLEITGLEESETLPLLLENYFKKGFSTFKLPFILTENGTLSCANFSCDPQKILKWIEQQSKPIALVTSNLESLQTIIRRYPKLRKYIIAEIDNPDQYKQIKDWKYGKTIWNIDSFLQKLDNNNLDIPYGLSVLSMMQGSLAISISYKNLSPEIIETITIYKIPIYISDTKNKSQRIEIKKKHELSNFYISP